MTDPKPSTNDILARIRGAASPQQAAESAPPQQVAGSVPSAELGEAEPSAAASVPVTESSAAAVPASTADILAAARAKAGGGGASKPAAKAGGAVPAKVGGAAPKSPADIMAAIRGAGGGSGAAAAAPVSKPAAAVASASPAAVVPQGMSAVEMIRAARQGAPIAVAAQPRVALPAKPLASKAVSKPSIDTEPRRSFLSQVLAVVCSPVVLAWSSFTGAIVASSLAVARFMMPNVLVEPPTKFKIGPPNDYAPGTVSTKWQAQFGVWVVNAEVDGAQLIYALSTVCTHLGCTPNWLEGEQKFKCPCHGSGFYKSGVNFEGPAPRPLERFGLRLAEDGMLEVDKSLNFQKELGQWSNSASFVPVA